MSFNITETYTTVGCVRCGVRFAIPQGFYKDLLRSRNIFWCPNGHEQHFSGKSEADKVREKLKRTEEAHERTKCSLRAAHGREESEKRSHAATKGQLTKTRNRIKKGVCPFCNRSFENLRRHMETKHGDEPCHT